MVTAASLRTQTSKDLARLAKQKGVTGWHSMRKEQLIRALLKLAKEKAGKKSARASATANGKSRSTRTTAKKATRSKKAVVTKDVESRVARKIREERARSERLKDLALANSMAAKPVEPESDRIVLVVRDAHWLQAYWDITKMSVVRIRAAMGNDWFGARPVLRLLEVEGDGTSPVENVVREIPVHGGVKNWYIDISDTGRSYRIAIGYLAADQERFQCIATSNLVTMPEPGKSALDNNWTDISADYERYFAQSGGYDSNTDSRELQNVFEEKMRRPMNPPDFVRLGSGLGDRRTEFPFEVDAQLVVYGATDPNANVTIGGEPARLEEDGTFCVRMELPDRRLVLPVVACSRDGTEQRTTVLAVERNTKVMEPVSRESGDQMF
ncbi:MAG: DUF4912 domain-containing protein [Planctomycetota bacterium]